MFEEMVSLLKQEQACVDSIDERKSLATDSKSHKSAISDFTAQLRDAS